MAFRRAGQADAIAIASRMRQEDIREALDIYGLLPSEAASAAVEASYWSYEPIRGIHERECYVATVDDTPEVLFGLGRTDTVGVGRPWLVSTVAISKLPLETIRASRLFLDKWIKETPILTNIIDSRNIENIKWLGLLGFKFLKSFEINSFKVEQFCKVGI